MSLLKEIKAAFGSFDQVPSISVTESRISGKWELQVKWVPEEFDRSVLCAIALKRGLVMTEEKGYITFHEA
jgi:hypothetical protein